MDITHWVILMPMELLWISVQSFGNQDCVG